MGTRRWGKGLAGIALIFVYLLALTSMSSSQTSSDPSAPPAPAVAQTPDTAPPQDDQSGGFVFKKEVEEVILHAVVVDDQNRLITDLAQRQLQSARRWQAAKSDFLPQGAGPGRAGNSDR